MDAFFFRNNDFIFFQLLAHGCGSGRRRSVAVQPGLVPRRLPCYAIYRVQRSSRNVPLFRQQVELLAGHSRGTDAIRPASERDPQGRQSSLASQPLSSLRQKLKEKRNQFFCVFSLVSNSNGVRQRAELLPKFIFLPFFFSSTFV